MVITCEPFAMDPLEAEFTCLPHDPLPTILVSIHRSTVWSKSWTLAIVNRYHVMSTDQYYIMYSVIRLDYEKYV